MRRIVVLIALGCGGRADSEECFSRDYSGVAHIDVPGQEGRIDGSVWGDGAFRTDEDKAQFCAEYGALPEAWFCRGETSYVCE